MTSSVCTILSDSSLQARLAHKHLIPASVAHKHLIGLWSRVRPDYWKHLETDISSYVIKFYKGFKVRDTLFKGNMTCT